MRDSAGGPATSAPESSPLSAALWIDGPRVRMYALGAIILYFSLATIAVVRGGWLYEADGTPTPVDFIAFWSAARMAIEGLAPAAYDWAAHKAYQVAAIGRAFEGTFGWHNPPHLLFVLLPFALLGYVPAWMTFNAVSAFLFALAFRQVLPVRGAWLIALGGPAAFLCTIAGQLGLLIATLMAWALVLLDRRPWLAGVFLGLLTVKPQFGLIFPVLLAATGRWRVFLAASAVTTGLILSSAVVFGGESWLAFHQSLTGETMAVLRRGGSDWTKLQSIYASAYLVTGHERIAMAVHGLCAIAILVLVTWLWRMPAQPNVRAAAAIAGGFLLTPYAYAYDAVVVIVAAGFLAHEALARGALPWERFLLCVAVILPVTFFVTASLATPAAMLLLLALAVRRALGEGAGGRLSAFSSGSTGQALP